MGNEDIWDAYSIPTKEIPGYDAHGHRIAIKTQVELDEEKYGEYGIESQQSHSPSCLSQLPRNNGLSGTSRKKEPNWSFRQGKKEPNWSAAQKREPDWSFRQGNKNEPNWSFRQGNKSEPNWSFKQGNQNEPMLCTRHNRNVPQVARKPEPNLLRDKSKDTARLMGISKLKHFSIDNISPMPEMGHTPNLGYNIVSKRKPEPNLLRDKSSDTARLSWTEGSDKKSPFTRQKKGMTLVGRGKKTGKMVSDRKLDHTHIHRKRIL